MSSISFYIIALLVVVVAALSYWRDPVHRRIGTFVPSISHQGDTSSRTRDTKNIQTEPEEGSISGDTLSTLPPSSSPSTTSSDRISCSEMSAAKHPNYAFYCNKLASQPHGDFIDNIHEQWVHDYDLLEKHHGYIQWLFPVFENSGMNSMSVKLNKEEARMIRESNVCAQRVIRSYRMMLNFWGMKLVDEETGEIARSDDYQKRYLNLSLHAHNYLRINRVLTSLGHLGFVRYKEPWLEFLTREIKSNGQLNSALRSLNNYWSKTILYDDPGYERKTKEKAEDRAESVFFQ